MSSIKRKRIHAGQTDSVGAAEWDEQYFLNIDEEGTEYTGPERRRDVHLSAGQIERIVDRAAERAVRQMLDDGYKAVGRNVIEKGMWLVGAISCGIFAYLASKGWIKF